MQFFRDLGSLVEQRWRDESYNEEAFPEIAAQALTEAAMHEHVDPWEIIRWVNTSPQLPLQTDIDAKFGDPPITLFAGPRFHIDVYYWLDGTTSIHQHAFCGAFQVMLGSSIHSQYRFEREQRINAHFSAGQITLNSVELLTQGDVKHILPGDQYIHSLFHLDRPSATAVIRTYHSPSGAPQYEYYKPYFAVDPFFKSQTLTRQAQCVALLLSMGHPQVDELIGELLAGADFHTTFALLNLVNNHSVSNRLEHAFGLTAGQERFQACLEKARRRHGGLADLVPPVIAEAQRQNNLIYRRSLITSSEHRFFLALLLNVPDRGRLLELVKQRFPDREPIQTVLDWVDELANTKVVGATEANVLGVNDLDDNYLFVLECLLEGLSIEQTKGAFEKEFSVEYTASLGDKPEELYNAISGSMLFKSIFHDLPATSPGETISDEQPVFA